MVELLQAAKPFIAAGCSDRRERKEIKMGKVVRSAIACMLLTSALPAHADVVPFAGSVTGVSNLIGVDASCAPLSFRTAIDPSSTVGTSSLGNFTFGTSTCISPGGAISKGTFTIDFGMDAFSGTFDGGSTPTATPGISDTAWLFTILDGTGRWAGASGTFNGNGIADARTRPTHVAIDFVGNINAVPEPASWVLMMLGFGGIGLAVRRRRRPALQRMA